MRRHFWQGRSQALADVILVALGVSALVVTALLVVREFVIPEPLERQRRPVVQVVSPPRSTR